jgi:heme oxygenase
MDFKENPQLSQTLKELEQLEKYIQEHNGDFSEEEINSIVDKASSAFELTQNELKKLEEYSREDLEKLIKTNQNEE